jgi:hypothetical protein
MRKVARRHRGAQRRRSPTLTPERIAVIVGIVRTWTGRLTWEALCGAIERQTGARYTRQALHNHVPIKAAYDAYGEKPAPAEREMALSGTERRLLTLQARVRELEKVRDALLEKFGRWAVNASMRGLTESFLDQPLQRIDRSEGR